MSEQNPYAPVGAPALMQPPAGMVPPQGFAPPPPQQGFAPAPVQSYDNPGMTLTELSFAPIPAEAPPAQVEPPPPAGPSLVANVLPSGGVARGRSLGGRTPLIALVLVLLVGAAGVFFGTGLFKSKEEPAPVVRKGKPAVTAPSASASASASAPAVAAKPSPAAKPAVKPLVGKTQEVNKANSRTFGGAYSVTVPQGWVADLNGGRNGPSNDDLQVAHPSGQAFSVVSFRTSFVKGPITPDKVAKIKADFVAEEPTAKILPGTATAKVLGAVATGFDADVKLEDGTPVKVRAVLFEKGGVIYAAVWAAKAEVFAKSTSTFEQIAATVKFAK